jgi:hypothetical protein
MSTGCTKILTALSRQGSNGFTNIGFIEEFTEQT